MLGSDGLGSKLLPASAPKVAKESYKAVKGIRAGIISNAQGGVCWVVNPLRMDKRTGPQQQVPWSAYGRELMEEVSMREYIPEHLKPHVVVPVQMAEQEEESKEGEVSYELHYTAGRGKRETRNQVYLFEDTDDVAARVTANRLMLVWNMGRHARELARLYQGEREVYLSDKQTAQKSREKAGRRVRKS